MAVHFRVWDKPAKQVLHVKRLQGGACFGCLDAAIDAVKNGHAAVVLVKQSGVNLVPLQVNCAIHEVA